MWSSWRKYRKNSEKDRRLRIRKKGLKKGPSFCFLQPMSLWVMTGLIASLKPFNYFSPSVEFWPLIC